MMARTFELRRESNRLPLTTIRLEAYGMPSFQCGVATIASARTIGGAQDVDRYCGDRVADPPHSPV
jgi:hypothetical protein